MRKDREQPLSRPLSAEQGTVVAETAVALPALAMIFVLLLWGMAVAAAQLRCIDAARIAARALARGEQDKASRDAAVAAAPNGAKVRVTRTGDLVQVQVWAQVPPPGPLLSTLPGIRISEQAVAAAESS